MARKDLPYLPLYVQDYMTDERLNECSPASQGVYIKIMCVLHKSSPYGKLLLRQNEQQKESKIENFAVKFAKHLPFDMSVILMALDELIREEVLRFDGNYIYQKRMVDDAELSLKRSRSGKLGANKTNKKDNDFASAKGAANSDIDIDITNSTITGISESSFVGKMIKVFKGLNPKYPQDDTKDGMAIWQIALKIGKMNNWGQHEIVNKEKEILDKWGIVATFILSDKWFSTRALFDINHEWQRVIQSMNSSKMPTKTIEPHNAKSKVLV